MKEKLIEFSAFSLPAVNHNTTEKIVPTSNNTNIFSGSGEEQLLKLERLQCQWKYFGNEGENEKNLSNVLLWKDMSYTVHVTNVTN